VNRADILTFVIGSGALDKYRSEDASLDSLIKTVSSSPETWQTYADVDVALPSPSFPASDAEYVARRRLEGIPNESGTEPLRAAMVRFVEYCVAHPDALIWDVTFNCPEHSYHVRGGLVDGQLEVICVIVGKHIPEYAMRPEQSAPR
jgi:hypothetical protein